MKRNTGWEVWGVVVLLGCSTLVSAQQNAKVGGSATISSSTQLPRLVKFGGTLTSIDGHPLSGMVGVTFAFYSSQTDGPPLWLETQNVQPDKNGHYTVLLGSTKPEGLPMDLFISEQAQWVGVQPEGQNEQPRVLLVSAPYALKAGDAETLGGKPASAFMAASSNTPSGNNGMASTVTGTGTKDYIPLWLSTTSLGNSKLFQSTSGDLGISTTTPAANLDVNGTSDIRNTLTLFPNGSAPTLSVNGTAFNVSNKGLVSFVSGQKFPGTGNGTVTSVGSGAGLTGGPIIASGTLSIATSGVTNAMLANSSLTVTANSPLNGGGAVSLGGSARLGLKSCAANQILQFISGAWACANAATGTVTSVGSGAGLTGGPITGSGTLSIATGGVSNAMLANPSLTLTAGTDLTGGGSVALGGSTRLNLDTTKVPQLSANNTFNGNQSVTGNIGVTGSIFGQTGSFSGNNTSQIMNVTQSGTGTAVNATATGGLGVFATGSTGVEGASSAASGGAGVVGVDTSTTGTNFGVYAVNDSALGAAVAGNANASPGTGVNGISNGSDGVGVLGQAPGSTLSSTGGSYEGQGAFGVWGDTAALGNGIGVLATADDAFGLVVENNSSSGVAALAQNHAGSGASMGVEAVSSSAVGIGAYGVAPFSSGVSPAGPVPTGVWGDTSGSLSADCPAAEGGSPCGIGVLGTVVNGNAVAGFSSDGYGDPEDATAFFQNNAPQQYSTVLATYGSSAGGFCTIDVAGDLYCTGSKSAVVPVDNGSRKVALYAVEAPENWFEDFGSGRLSDGSAVVALEPTFGQAVDTAVDYHVFLTPNGDSRGLYVFAKTPTSFEVREQGGGTSNITFDYRIVARRKGYEDIRLADKTAQFKVPQHKATHAPGPPAPPKLPHALIQSLVRPAEHLSRPPLLNRK
jgi:hypothetical protein